MTHPVSIADAAEFLDVTDAEVYRLIGTGELDSVIELGGGPETDQTGPLSRLRIGSEVLSAYRQGH